MKTERLAPGAYEVTLSTGDKWSIDRNLELQGRAKWVAYDQNDQFMVFDPVHTLAEALEGIAHVEQRREAEEARKAERLAQDAVRVKTFRQTILDTLKAKGRVDHLDLLKECGVDLYPSTRNACEAVLRQLVRTGLICEDHGDGLYTLPCDPADPSDEAFPLARSRTCAEIVLEVLHYSSAPRTQYELEGQCVARRARDWDSRNVNGWLFDVLREAGLIQYASTGDGIGWELTRYYFELATMQRNRANPAPVRPNAPRVAEVILDELMVSPDTLDFAWLVRQCLRHACDHGTTTVSDTLYVLKHAGLVEPMFHINSGYWRMTPEGRALLRTRPAYDCRRAIQDELAANGPCTFDELRHACRRQAADYSPAQFTLALYQAIKDCTVQDVTDDGAPFSSFDLPN